MSSALSADRYVFEGIWTNFDRGPVLGLTLTMSPQRAQFLTAALALTVSVAGAQLWRIFQFGVHQYRATSTPQSLLYHFTQTILRNPATDLNTLWRLIRVGYAWRHQRGVKVWKMLAPLIFWSLLHLVLVALAGIFVSKALVTKNDVLSVSPYCGLFDDVYFGRVYTGDATDHDAVSLAFEYNNHVNSRYSFVQQHVDLSKIARQGYNDFPLPRIICTAAIAEGQCPLPQSMCHRDLSGSSTFDTGLLSSHSHFGLNAAMKDRVLFRLKSQCAPLDDTSYVTGWQNIPATSDLPAHQASDAFYGPSLSNSRNATFTITKQVAECDERQIRPAYALNSDSTPPGGDAMAGTSTFDPIPELQLTDADLSLIMLSFSGYYEQPVLDPWFSAEQPVNVSNPSCLQDTRLLYTRGRPLTTIACTQQWQICAAAPSNGARSNGCTPLLDLTQLYRLLQDPQLNLTFTPRQRATAERLIRSAASSSFYYVVMALSQSTSPPLKARLKIAKTVGPALPADQWLDETQYWMDIVLAYLQQSTLDYSTGQFAASTDYINVTKPSTGHVDELQDANYWLCQRQTVNSDAYINFNFFALLVVAIVCLILIPGGLWIDDIVAYWRSRKLQYTGANARQLMWNVNSDLWLLRVAAEVKCRIPFTTWNLIPVTHIGNEISINDLMPDSFENIDGHIVPVDHAMRIRGAPGKKSQAMYGIQAAANPAEFELSGIHQHKTGHSSFDDGSIYDMPQDGGEQFSNTSRVGLAVSTEGHQSRALYEEADLEYQIPIQNNYGTQQPYQPSFQVTQTSLQPMIDDGHSEWPSKTWTSMIPQRWSGQWRSSWQSR